MKGHDIYNDSTAFHAFHIQLNAMTGICARLPGDRDRASRLEAFFVGGDRNSAPKSRVSKKDRRVK